VGVVGLEKVGRDGVPELMARDRHFVAFGVLDRDGEAGLDIAHRFADVFPVKGFATVLEGVQQGQRKHLLDVCRRVAIRDAGELFAAARRIKRRIVLLLVEVERRDVLAVLAVRQSEHDLPSEPSWPGEGFVED